MPNASPADDADVWWGGLRWVEAVWMQARRFEDVFFEYQSALADAEMRANCNTTDGAAWRGSYDNNFERYDPRRPIRVPTVVLAMQVANDLDFLILGIRNVLRAQDRLPATASTKMTDQEVFALLRNVAEHWDEVGGRSADKLASAYPNVSPGIVKYTNKEIWVGSVPLSRIRAWLARVRQSLAAALGTLNVDVPPDLASVVPGDDELAWPNDRRHYRLWDAPRVEIEDWPTTPMPEAGEKAIHQLGEQRFANLRARDHAE